jgi:hypothetical protein
MASMKRPRLQAVQACPGHRLELTFIDGRRLELDMRADVASYPGLKPLQASNAFATAALGDDGWTVEWPALDIQIGADTLLLDALAQAAPDENTRTFIGWRARTGFGLEQAAAALGVAARTISRYSSGREAVPRTLALACKGWEAMQSEQQHKHA